MARKAKELYREALSLSEIEREELARMLMGQAGDGFATPEIEQAWLDETRRVDKAVDEGKEALIPAEEVMRELRERYGE
jgi:hypothetical protein